MYKQFANLIAVEFSKTWKVNVTCDDPKSLCNECEHDQPTWQCRNFNMHQTKNNIATESLKDDKKESVNVVNFIRETGLIYQI
jgi:hypothetical protein